MCPNGSGLDLYFPLSSLHPFQRPPLTQKMKVIPKGLNSRQRNYQQERSAGVISFDH